MTAFLEEGEVVNDECDRISEVWLCFYTNAQKKYIPAFFLK